VEAVTILGEVLFAYFVTAALLVFLVRVLVKT
jgi:hypothetical protein